MDPLPLPLPPGGPASFVRLGKAEEDDTETEWIPLGPLLQRILGRPYVQLVRAM